MAGGAPGAAGPGGRKIASIGIAVRRWTTFHGFGLNVSTDLSVFAGLDPCGFDGSVMTSLARELGRPVDVDAVRRPVAAAVARALGFEAELVVGPGAA
jgi:lipoate-protein ligase B